LIIKGHAQRIMGNLKHARYMTIYINYFLNTQEKIKPNHNKTPMKPKIAAEQYTNGV